MSQTNPTKIPPTRKRVLVLGGGVGGAAAAKRIAKHFDVTLVAKTDFTYYGDIPKIFFEGLDPSSATHPLEPLRNMGVKLVRGEAARIDPANRRVTLTDGRSLEYDELVVALGAEVEDKPHLWSLGGLKAFSEEFSKSQARRVVVAVEGTPYRCPPAPFDVAHRLKAHLERLGRKPEYVKVVHPEKQPLIGIGQHVYRALMESMESVGVEVVGGYTIREVDWEKGLLVSEGGEKLGFDLLHLVPKHKPPRPVAESELATPQGWANVGRDLKSAKYDDVHMIGDVAAPTLGLPMAGFLALYGAESVAAKLAGTQPKLKPEASCPVEAGHASIIPLCDFGPKLEGKPTPECVVARADPMFMAFFRDLARTKFLSELGLA